MKKISRLVQIMVSMMFMFAFTPDVNGQLLKKLGKRAEKAAERAVERRVEKETTEKTEEVLDSILEPGSKGEQEKQLPIPQEEPNNDPEAGGQSPNKGSSGGTSPASESSESKTISVYSKFDFVPGDKLLFFDDFSNDFVGDFPSKWNTNGTGEIVTVNDLPEKWFEIKSGHSLTYIPDVSKLPEEYTIEFDLLTKGLDKKTSSTARLVLLLSDNQTFERGNNFVLSEISFCQYAAIGITMENKINGKREIRSIIDADIREEVLNQPHISVAVNKRRFRLWVNEKKYIDIPRILPEGGITSTLKFGLENFKDGKDRVFISNLKVAEGGLDLRRTLIADGKVSTNGILFDSGSANIQPQSMGIIRQIYQVLQQESDINLKIVGHTDSDGNDDTNLSLSKKRAEAVKNALVSVYNVSSDRLSTEGKGESEPVGDNGTTDGKAQNRRVEFIKQ